MIPITVVIPSKGRPTCHRAVALFEDPVLCVPEEEEASYAEAHPKTRKLLHPNDLVGLGRVRQWVLDQVSTECVFMVDDDVNGLWSIVGQRAREITRVESIMAVIQNTAEVARAAGTCLFGFSHTIDTRHFSPYRPFTFTGYVNGFAMGIIGREIRFDAELDTKQDIDFSLQVLHRKRFLWKDLRFGFRNDKWFRRTGGNAGIRTSATVARDIARLNMKWGDAIRVEHHKRSGPTHQNVRVFVQR